MGEITTKDKSPSWTEAVVRAAKGSSAWGTWVQLGGGGSLTCEAGSCRRIQAVAAVGTVTAGDLIIGVGN